jgi:hypothetical protein
MLRMSALVPAGFLIKKQVVATIGVAKITSGILVTIPVLEVTFQSVGKKVGRVWLPTADDGAAKVAMPPLSRPVPMALCRRGG